MTYAILGTVLGLCFFIVPLWAYRKGLNDGIRLSNNKSIEPIKTPIQVMEKAFEQRKQKKENELFTQGYNNVMSFDGTPQKGVEE